MTLCDCLYIPLLNLRSATVCQSFSVYTPCCAEGPAVNETWQVNFESSSQASRRTLWDVMLLRATPVIGGFGAHSGDRRV